MILNQFSSFLDICPGLELLVQVIALFLVPYGTSMLFSKVAVPIYVPSTVQESSLFSTHSQAFIVCRLFDGGHSDQSGDFDLHFSGKQSLQTSFQVTVGHLFVSFGEISVLIFCPVFDWVICLFVLILNCMNCLYIWK